ncbi:MAG: acetoacetyl-CoA synthetase [Chloroflexota bacterium]|nr:MAG: acetoacetyl-CoA synthetase [Chloroflexota bacterium]
MTTMAASAAEPAPIWTPPADARERSTMGRWLAWLERERGLRFETYDAAWRWSVTDLEGFWSSVWAFFDVRSAIPYERPLAERRMPGARWFPGATLNYAEHALRLPGRAPDDVVLVSISQSRPTVRLTAAELRQVVSRTRAGLRRLGVGRGDRVAAYLPNVAETVVAALATGSLGAVWSSCAPEFGVAAVVDRFAQIEPTVLLAVDGYRYGAKAIDRAAEVEAIRAALPSLRATVVLPYLDPDRPLPAGAMGWADLVATPPEPGFEPVPFDHPLYILYSSGTTGLPKAIVHGHGGILLEHLKALGLHTDLGPADRFFWFTTTGWMMWNYLVSGLAVGSTIVCFDGDPAWPDLLALWRMAAEERLTYFGTSAPYLMACRKAGLRPGAELDLAALRGVGSTGAPLPAAGFEWVAEAVGRSIQLGSLSGGTDVCTGFVGPAPIVPVWPGEISCRMLGAKVEAFDEAGRSIVGRQGELVLTEPLPSMPVGFWNDPDGSRYRAAYFSTYPGVWRHGDWITITERGSCIITGRSDATLKRAGVRLGTAEFYAVVEGLPEIADSLVVHLEDEAGGPGELLLFVALRPGLQLDDRLRRRIAGELRRNLSPRHVPDEIVAVPAIPRTLSGKKLEVPVKRILQGADPETVASRDALAVPAALDAFVAYADGRRERAAATPSVR